MHIINGKKPGPVLLVCATLHGDEVNGIVILQKLLNLKALNNLCGTLIAIPVVNIYGLINHSRFLPDGGDLESSFPGSEKGSFSARLAYLFSTHVLDQCSHCIAIRSPGEHLFQIPHVHYHKEDEVAQRLVRCFNVPYAYPTTDSTGFFSRSSEKPLRPTLIFEGGEAHRSDEWTIKGGVKGIAAVMQDLEMVRLKSPSKIGNPLVIEKTVWLRSPVSGLCYFEKKVGSRVSRGEPVASITDPFGSSQQYERVYAETSGIVTAFATHPLVNEGQSIIQLGHYEEKWEDRGELDIPSYQPDIIND